jgi:aspartate oxidase
MVGATFHGIAGMSAALAASQSASVLLLSKSRLNDSNTFYAQGGIAAVGQLQLLQPFFGLTLAATLLREAVSWPMVVVAATVALCVAGAKHFAK